ncbi:MFS transporter [Nonomuraea sp. NPDC048826]|uniref:MFS transporter n=1 Tax=Nonomuraea sp. NPDC048826 TaxID=3364347 RepID=UPI0037177F69
MTGSGVGAAKTWNVMTLLMAFMMINLMDKAVIGLVAKPMKDDLGLTATQYGTVAGTFYLLFSVSALVFGFIGDRVSSRWLLAGLAVVWSAAQLPVALPAAGLGVIVVTRLLLGAGEGPAFPLAMHTAFTWSKAENRGLAGSALQVSGALGALVGGPVIVAVTEAYGWRSAFTVLGVAGLVWAAIWVVAGGDGPYLAREEKGDRPRRTYRRLFTSGTWYGALIAGFGVSWTLSVHIAFLPLYLEDVAGFARSSIGLLTALPSLTGALLILLGGVLSRQLIGRSRRLALGILGGCFSLAAGVCLVLLPHASPGWPVVVLACLAFGAGPAQTPLTVAAISAIVPDRQRSAALGTWYALVSIAAVAGPVATGLVVDAAPTQTAGYGPAFGLAGGLLVLGGLAAIALIRPDRPHSSMKGSRVARPPRERVTGAG